MRFVSIIRATVLATVLVVAFSGIATASTPPATVYHGAWDGGTACGADHVYTGVWNVNLKADGTAEVSARIFKDGDPHAAWGGNYFFQPWLRMSLEEEQVFNLHNGFLNGANFVLTRDGTLAYTIVDYCTLVGESGGDVVLYGHVLH
jgi:hypothetical protein